MKKTLYRLALVFGVALVGKVAQAQNTLSGYFVEGNLYRFEINPAIGNEQNFVSIPGLGNMNFNLQSNVGLDKFLYNVNGRTTTFLNPGVSTSEFLNGLENDNEFSMEDRVQLMSAGFKAFGGYNTVAIGVRSNMGVSLPKSIFELVKDGPKNRSYDISDMEASANAFAEISLGHSRKINDQLRVGANLKFLLGGADIEANFNKAQLTLGTNGYTAVTNATVNASVKGLKYVMKEKMRGAEGEQTLHRYVGDVDIDGAGLNGFGLGLDLGAVYTMNEDWEFSASLLDLGFISWNNNMQASTNGDRTFQTSKHVFSADDDAKNSFSREMDRLGEDLAQLYELQDNGDKGGHTTGLDATMNLAAKYTLPVYRQLGFGLMNTTRFGEFGWTDFRLSANWNACKIFSASANLGVGTYGASFGWMLNLHPNGFNLFVAMDRTMGKTTKQYVPLSANAQFNIGMNIPF